MAASMIGLRQRGDVQMLTASSASRFHHFDGVLIGRGAVVLCIGRQSAGQIGHAVGDGHQLVLVQIGQRAYVVLAEAKADDADTDFVHFVPRCSAKGQ